MPVLQLEIRSDESPVIGHVSKMDWLIRNTSDHPVIVLEIQPEQPCEERMNLVRLLYGDVTYVEKFDQFLYDALPQKASLIPVYEGYIAPGGTLSYSEFYRPFARRETFSISYARLDAQKVYFRKEAEANGSRFATDGKDTAQVIVPKFLETQKGLDKIQFDYGTIGGKESSLCYCEVLGRYQQYPPYSICKEWDSDRTVKFRVGDNQQGEGPVQHSAGWKFQGEFEVFFGDGMYTHGEFVSITPAEAPNFMRKVEGRFSFKKIEYFLTEHYYDLEPSE